MRYGLLLLIGSCAVPAAVQRFGPSGTLLRVGDSYQSVDGRFKLLWSPETDMWIVFKDGNTEPACEADWGYR